jgi:hypothetical protein
MVIRDYINNKISFWNFIRRRKVGCRFGNGDLEVIIKILLAIFIIAVIQKIAKKIL